MEQQTKGIRPRLKLSFKFKKPSARAAVLAIVAILVVVGVPLGYYLQKNSSDKAGNYPYKYKQLSSFTMPGDAKGSGISLQKPVELTALSTSSPKQSQTFLNHTLTKNAQQPVTMAQIFLASVNTGVELQDTYKKNINTMVTDPKNVSHEAVIKPLKDYVTQRLKATLTTTFSEAKPLPATDNIKSNAWYLTFTATPKDAKDKATQPDLSGQAIMAIGKTSYYYIMVYSLANNWQSNQKVWDQVINSIKLDQ